MSRRTCEPMEIHMIYVYICNLHLSTTKFNRTCLSMGDVQMHYLTNTNFRISMVTLDRHKTDQLQKEKENKDEGTEFVNPIDPDKITENPGLIPYPHTIGSPAFAPTRKGAIKSRSMKAMEEQSTMQMRQIQEQIALLARQAEKLRDRVEISKAIYEAEMGFQPIAGNTYHLYARDIQQFVLSMIGPEEWGRKIPFKHFVGTVRLLADHTWDVLHSEL